MAKNSLNSRSGNSLVVSHKATIRIIPCSLLGIDIGRYRDVIRRFVRGDPGLVGEVASCIAGSSDLYADDDRLPLRSINFISFHDGFTLHDLVSYNGNHNEANSENNRDGCDNNLSWNCGAEGETDHAEVLALGRRQAKNLISILLLSQGGSDASGRR